MKLALLLLVLGTAFMATHACYYRCYYRWAYVRVCNVYWCKIIAVRRLVCGYYGCSGKRSAEPELKIGYPCDFAEYDTSKNGKIEFKEFTAALKMSNSTDVFENFQKWDKNKDGAISCREFLNSEYEFQCKPRGCTMKPV